RGRGTKTPGQIHLYRVADPIDPWVSPGPPREVRRSMTTKTSAPAKPQLSAVLKAELSSVPIRLVTAWEAHDAEAFSMLFVEDGTLILPGVYIKGRDEIRKYMEAEYAGKYQGTSVTGTPLDIKPLGTNAVALITVGGVLMPG